MAGAAAAEEERNPRRAAPPFLLDENVRDPHRLRHASRVRIAACGLSDRVR